MRSLLIAALVLSSVSAMAGILQPSASGGGGLASTDVDTSLELKTILTDETGSGAAVFGTNPTLAGATITGTVSPSSGAFIKPAKSIKEDFNAYSTTAQIAITSIASSTWNFDGTNGTYNIMYGPSGYTYGVTAQGGAATARPAIIAAGLSLAGDQVSGEGYYIQSNFGPSATGGPFVVGVDPAFYFLIKFAVSDVDGLTFLGAGFRKAGPYVDNFTGITDYAVFSVINDTSPMAIYTSTRDDSASATHTDTTQTVADGVAVQVKILVSAAGVVTFQDDIATPGTLAAPTVTQAFTWDDGDPLVPFFQYSNDATLADDVVIYSWEAGYQ